MRLSARFQISSPPQVAPRPAPLTTSICLSTRYQPVRARCMAVRNGRLHNSRRTGRRKRVRSRVASSIHSGGSSADVELQITACPKIITSAVARCAATLRKTTQHAFLSKAFHDYAEDSDWLVASGPQRRRLRWRRCRVLFPLCHSECLKGSRQDSRELNFFREAALTSG